MISKRRRAAGLIAAIAMIGAVSPVAPVSTADAVADDTDWLTLVNAYRASSGLPPVTERAEFSADAANHSCYMLEHGITHDEDPATSGYTVGGDAAGNAGNVAVSSSVDATARDHLELWMTGPFHALGLLRPSTSEVGFGMCADDDAPTRWESAATLDVLRGIDADPARPSEPVVFPGRGATVGLYRFITENPDPLQFCGWDAPAGLPLVAMMTASVAAADSTLTGPDGPIETCTLHAANTTGAAQAVLDADRAVVVVPRHELADGEYRATVTSDAGDVHWTFDVRRGAFPTAGSPDSGLPADPSPAPDRRDIEWGPEHSSYDPVDPFRSVDSRRGLGTDRLAGGTISRIALADADVAAVSANIAAVDADGPGFVSAFACDAGVPEVSTLNYGADGAVANQATIPLSDGDACFYSLRDVDVVVDVNGYYRFGETHSAFAAVAPVRLLDTRRTGRLTAGRERRVSVAPEHAPAGASAAAFNVTAIGADRPGFLTVHPCGTPADVSTVNYAGGDIVPNSAVVPLDADGDVCVTSLAGTDVALDFTGYLATGSGSSFATVASTRIFDSRTDRATSLAPGEVVELAFESGADGIGLPTGTTAVSINLTAADPASAGFVTAYPCDAERPASSNLNIGAVQQATANGSLIKLSDDGRLCLFSLGATHLIVDLNGFWTLDD